MASHLRPSFIESALEDAKDVYKAKNGWALVPFILLLFIALSAAASYFVPEKFFWDANWDVSATVYTGLLAFNALTLALAWGAIGRIYESIAQPGFSSFLRNGSVLPKYLFYISFVHVTQAVAAFVTLVALVTLFIRTPFLYDRIMLALTLTTTLYALRWAWGAVEIVQDLSWHYATYDALEPEEKKKLRLAVSNDDPA